MTNDFKQFGREKATENLREKPEPDCDTCMERTGCDRALSGSFCTRWRTRETEREGIDPNEAWTRGDGDAPES